MGNWIIIAGRGASEGTLTVNDRSLCRVLDTMMVCWIVQWAAVSFFGAVHFVIHLESVSPLTFGVFDWAFWVCCGSGDCDGS